jgi:hypothetical protein
MERDAELAAKTGQPIRADPQRARPIIALARLREQLFAASAGVQAANETVGLHPLATGWR